MRLRVNLFLCAAAMMCLVGGPVWALDQDDPAILGAWLFDEGMGDTVADETPAGNVGEFLDGDFEWEPGMFGQSAVAFGGGSIDVLDFDSTS